METKVSKEELIQKYGDVKVKFNSYYKYSFWFKSECKKYDVGIGGDSDDIYKLDLIANKEYSILELSNYGGFECTFIDDFGDEITF